MYILCYLMCCFVLFFTYFIENTLQCQHITSTIIIVGYTAIKVMLVVGGVHKAHNYDLESVKRMYLISKTTKRRFYAVYA